MISDNFQDGFCVLVSQLTRIGARLFPKLAAHQAARRRFAHLVRDRNNFTHPDQLAPLLAPYRLVSFDLFDTLVWRKVALDDVHRKTAEFGERTICGDDGPLPAGLLLNARGRHQEAIKQAGMRADPPQNEADLTQVLDSALAPYLRNASVRAGAVQALIAYEIETERRVLTVDSVMRDFVKALRAQGKTVILTSDMYFPDAWLKVLVDNLGLLSLFDHVFVSASVGVTKHSGLLFEHIDQTLGSHGWRRLHLGDHWTNDVVRPRQHGWDALHYFNRENEIRKSRLEHETRLGAHSTPAARRDLVARIEAADPADALVRLVSAGFHSFARQVLSRACIGRFDRVLFLTRDGTIYRHLLQQLVADSGAADHLSLPPFQDLAFSRRAGVLLTCPAAEDPNWTEYLRFHVRWMRDEEATLGAILATFALQHDEIGVLAQANPDLALDDLAADAAMVAALDAALQAKRGRVVAYLDQQDLFAPDQRLLLVDIGYSGTILKSLTEHLYRRERDGQPVNSVYEMQMFAANRFYAGNLDKLHPRVSMPEPLMVGRTDWRQRAAACNFAWLEPFAVDRGRGSLRDYRDDGTGRMQPVFGPGASDLGPVCPERLLRTARGLDRLLRAAPLADRDADRAISDAIVARFANPRRRTLKGVEGVTHQAGLAEITEGGLLRRVRPWRLRADLSRCLHEDRWVQGSMSASRLGWLNPALNRVIGLITR